MPGLYGTAYALRFALKRRGVEEKVGPLEGLYRIDGGSTDLDVILDADRQRLAWTLLIVLPTAATADELEAAFEAGRAKMDRRPRRARRGTLSEGRVAQVLARGPVLGGASDDRAPRCRHRGGRPAAPRRPPRDLPGDPNRSAPERLRTLLRHPVDRPRVTPLPGGPRRRSRRRRRRTSSVPRGARHDRGSWTVFGPARPGGAVHVPVVDHRLPPGVRSRCPRASPPSSVSVRRTPVRYRTRPAEGRKPQVGRTGVGSPGGWSASDGAHEVEMPVQGPTRSRSPARPPPGTRVARPTPLSRTSTGAIPAGAGRGRRSAWPGRAWRCWQGPRRQRSRPRARRRGGVARWGRAGCRRTSGPDSGRPPRSGPPPARGPGEWPAPCRGRHPGARPAPAGPGRGRLR